jgi:hypothetical protein
MTVPLLTADGWCVRGGAWLVLADFLVDRVAFLAWDRTAAAGR